MKVTTFYDLHSGGHQQENFAVGYIILPEQEAIERFKELYNREPSHVTCHCCGTDYAVNEFDSLEEVLTYYPQAVNLQVPS